MRQYTIALLTLICFILAISAGCVSYEKYQTIHVTDKFYTQGGFFNAEYKYYVILDNGKDGGLVAKDVYSCVFPNRTYLVENGKISDNVYGPVEVIREIAP